MCGQAAVPQTVPPARPVDRSGAVVAPQGATRMWGCEHRRRGRKAAAGRTTTEISPRRPIGQGHGASGVQNVRRQPARNAMCGSAEAWWSGLRLQMKPGRRGLPARACSQVTARSVCRASGARRVSTDVCTTCPDFVRATGSVRDARSCSTRRGCNKQRSGFTQPGGLSEEDDRKGRSVSAVTSGTVGRARVSSQSLLPAEP